MSVLARTASGSQEVIFDVGDKDGRATFELEYTFLQRADRYSSWDRLRANRSVRRSSI